MRNFKNIGGLSLSGLLLGGLVAGAIGLAQSDQSSTYGPGGQSPSMGSGSSQTTESDTSFSSAPATGQPTTPSMGGSGSMGAAADLPPNVTPGWKIRVCSEKTKVDNLTFAISQPDKAEKAEKSDKAVGKPYGDKTSADRASTGQDQFGTATPDPSASGTMVQQTAMWSRGQASEITLPAELQDAERIKIEAIGQKDKDAAVCVLYNDHVAKKLNFEDRKVSTIRKTESGECGC